MWWEKNKSKENSRPPTGVEILPVMPLVVCCSEVVWKITVSASVAPASVDGFSVVTSVGCVVCSGRADRTVVVSFVRVFALSVVSSGDVICTVVISRGCAACAVVSWVVLVIMVVLST